MIINLRPFVLVASFAALAGGLALSSCKDKPTSGSNTSEYRDGVSGASSGTIKKSQEGKETPITQP